MCDWVEKTFGRRDAPAGLRKLLQRLGCSFHKASPFLFKADPDQQEAFVADYEHDKEKVQAEGWRREQRYLPRQRIWIFNIDERWARDAAIGGNIARYINHACRPNCYVHIVDGTIWIRAARPIRKGEELTYNYNTDGEGLIKCRCRPGCQKLL